MIEINDLSFGYKHTQVFSNISLTFPTGAIYGLLGENGVGKTTLLKLICGLIRPSQGSCKIDDFTSQERLPQMLQRIVFLPDEVSLPDDATPQRYVNELQPFYPTFAQATFLHLMQELDVDPNRRFREMSFGQQKKSLIAATLSLGTNYVLLDEPTNGLDIPSKTRLRHLLSQRADENTAIILSTHQVKDVENLIDPIVILSRNNVLLNASVKNICEKLHFEYSPSRNPNALYSDLTPSGYLNVVPNTGSEESQLNVEALFNAVMLNKNTFRQMFKTQNS